MTQVIEWTGDCGDGVCIGGGDPNEANLQPLKTMTKFDFNQLQKFFPKQEIKLNNVVDPKKLEGIKDLELVSEFLQDWWQFGSDADDLLFTADAAMQSGQFAHVDAGVGATITAAGYGNDRVVGDARNNVIYGNNAYAGAAQAYVDDIFSFTDFSRAFDQGIADGDDLAGGAGDDVLYGCSGDDLLTGGFGNDRLFGGTGNDFLDAGYGSDLLKGGDGIDIFKLNQSFDGAGQRTAFQHVTDMKDQFDRIKFGGEIKAAVLANGVGFEVLDVNGAANHVVAMAGDEVLFSFAAQNGTTLGFDTNGVWVAENTGDLNAMASFEEAYASGEFWAEPGM